MDEKHEVGGGHEGTSGELRDQAAKVGDVAQRKAVELKDEGGEQLRSQFDQRTNQVGQQARTLAGSLRRTGNELETREDSGMAAKVATGVADRLDRMGGYLEGARGDDLLRDAERFARQRPWLVAGTAAAAGFAVSRLLKASSERRYEGSSGNGAHERRSLSAGGSSGSRDPEATAIDGARIPSSRASVVEPGV